MSAENVQNQESYLRKQLDDINNCTLEALRTTYRLRQQRQAEYDEKIEKLKKQDFSKLELELELLKKKRDEKQLQLTERQRDRSKELDDLKFKVQQLLAEKLNREEEGERDSDNATGDQKAMWIEELKCKASIRDELKRSVSGMECSIKIKTECLEELKASLQTAKSEALAVKDMVQNEQQRITTFESVQPKLIISTGASNSLFNEVNDKRVELKKLIEDLKTKCRDLEKLTDSTEKEKRHVLQIRRDVQNILDNHSKEALSEYNDLIEKYRNTRLSVEKTNLEYEKVLCEKEKLSVPSNFSDDIFSFHDEFIKCQEITRDRLENLSRAEFYLNNTIYRQGSESGKKHLMYSMQHSQVLDEITHISGLIKGMEQQARENKNNDPPCETANTENKPVAPVEKKVLFHDSVTSPPPRRRGRLIQSTPVHIPSDLLQKKNKVMRL